MILPLPSLPGRMCLAGAKHMRLWILVAAFAGCSPTVDQKGWIAPSPTIWKKLTVGTTTPDDAVTLLGTPTVVSTFDNRVWYYIERITRTRATFSHPALEKEYITRLTFDDTGRLSQLERLEIQDIAEVKPDSEETPTRGYKPSILSQMFRNLGRFNSGRVNNP